MVCDKMKFNIYLGGYRMETSFYLIRHGETEWNRAGRLQGHQDVALSEEGVSQAELCGVRMSKEPIDVILSSDLQRAFHTAQHIAKGFRYSVAPYAEFRERHYGKWEGLTREEIHQQYGKTSDGSLHGVETLESMQNRALKRIQSYVGKPQYQRIAIVSHGGLINALLHYITEGKYGTGITRLDNTSISLVSCMLHKNTCKWNVHYINDVSHLPLR
jgi:broad specificity phosphatase PhoE